MYRQVCTKIDDNKVKVFVDRDSKGSTLQLTGFGSRSWRVHGVDDTVATLVGERSCDELAVARRGRRRGQALLAAWAWLEAEAEEWPLRAWRGRCHDEVGRWRGRGSGKGRCCCCCAFQLLLHCSGGKPRHKGRPSDKCGDTVIIGRRRKGGYWVAGGSPIAALARHGHDVVTVVALEQRPGRQVGNSTSRLLCDSNADGLASVVVVL